ncbi:FliE Flagellar hook-basal body protein [Caulobacteraceae bacterium]|jgi:flagellar hook-basal body complex protein FliE
MMTAMAAAKAYAAAGSGVTLGGAAPAAASGQDFGDLLKSVMGDAMKASKNAETQMAAQVAGKAELIDVVTAISSAEASLETVMAVRDQVISAYQEIMRMPI